MRIRSSRFIHAAMMSLALVTITVLPALAKEVTVFPGTAHGYLPAPAATVWPMFQHDTRHTGCSPYVGPQAANLKWTFSLDNNKDYIYTMSPAIAGDGTLYVGGYNGSNLLHAVNPDGTEKWPLWAGNMDYTPAIGSDGTIYINQYSASNYNRLVAYRPDSTSKYHYDIGSDHGMTCSPAIGPDNTLYFTTDAHNTLYAVRDNGSSLDEIWTYTAADAFKWQSPALATSGPNSGTIYISAGNILYAINSSTGSKKWDLDLVSAGIYTTPAIGADGTIYIYDGYGRLVAITDTGLAGGVIKWEHLTIGGNGQASAAIGPDGTIYIGNNNGPVHGGSIFWAINDNVTYATVRWQRDNLGATDASAVIGADSTVYYQTRTGMFYALDGANNGATKWSYPLAGGLRPAAIDAGGCVYVGTWDSKLYCFAPPAPTVTSVAPSQGTQGQTLTIVITGTDFYGIPAITFSGTGVTAGTPVVNSLTQMTVTVVIAPGAAPGARDISVTTGGGTGGKTACFTVNAAPVEPPPAAPTIPLLIGSGSGGSSGTSTSVTDSPQGPVQLSNIRVVNASLSSARVAPGTPVTVTAGVTNTGTGNGTAVIKIYVNGLEEAGKGVTVNSGGTSTITFDVARSEPGTYSVYVGGQDAGSFSVDDFTPNAILIVSGALVFLSLALGIVYIARRRVV